MLHKSVLCLLLVFAFATPNMASATTSQELQRALAAAERARHTPHGEAYLQQMSRMFGEILVTAGCLPIYAPGVRQPGSFESVLIVGRNGRVKWIIRDTDEPMAACYFTKFIKTTFPAPPADNWPVTFAFRASR